MSWVFLKVFYTKKYHQTLLSKKFPYSLWMNHRFFRIFLTNQIPPKTCFFPILSPKKNKKANKNNTFLVKKSFTVTSFFINVPAKVFSMNRDSLLGSLNLNYKKKKTKHTGGFHEKIKHDCTSGSCLFRYH